MGADRGGGKTGSRAVAISAMIRRMTATQIAAQGGAPQLINWWNLRWVALALAP